MMKSLPLWGFHHSHSRTLPLSSGCGLLIVGRGACSWSLSPPPQGIPGQSQHPGHTPKGPRGTTQLLGSPHPHFLEGQTREEYHHWRPALEARDQARDEVRERTKPPDP